MSQDTQQPLLKDLANELPDDSRAEYYRILHETGISPNDVELARLLKALQLYKVYYESIPVAVQAAAGEIERLKQEIDQLSKEIRGSLDAGIQLVGQVVLEAERVHEEITRINLLVDDAMRVATEGLTSRMAEYLTAGIEKSVVPLENRLIQLAVSNQDFDDAIARNIKATAAIQKSTAIARRYHLWTYAVCSLAVVCSSVLFAWIYLDRWYEARIRTERETIVNQIEKNRDVLHQLARSQRILELHQDPQHPNYGFLVMSDATGWQSSNNQGVIKFKK